ncbi:MOSC domain-containing protein [Cognatishimia sp. SS12]|uniref:MOSC domain-containing protein n=1 Tax=Cognatishimia sp. SS12 TaxID=2979465 RepID=UPI00232D76FC|nr:MOSC N-terminal beta barrel domain-containing protein [Cognatishimia sp. SS12]MDC0738337.1 MOSC domain-containing protein [Cognatishimia sp. SS12]
MTAVSALWRHPIKAHGREPLERVALKAGHCMPWDRHWAVTHDATKADGSAWAACINFSRGASAPRLMAMTACLDEAAQRITLSHPDLPDLTFSPDTEAAAFVAWVRPIMPPERRQSTGILSVPGTGLTDSKYPSLSIINSATNAALGAVLGQDLSMDRWRGNIHVTGLPAWQEFDWVGRQLRIGGAEFEVQARIERCVATEANPETGLRDAETLKALRDTWDHQDFGVKVIVTKDGEIAIGDTIEVL